MKRITLLGSTGSIGEQTLDIVAAYPEQFSIFALAAHSNIKKLAEQAKRFRPKYVAIYNSDLALELEKLVPEGVEVITKMEALCFLATHSDSDIVVSAIVGSIGIEPTYYAAQCGKTIALANKESLVAAGSLIMKVAAENGATILPIDSEHSALFQCMHDSSGLKRIKKMVVTASGGPFLHHTKEQLEQVTVDQALKHPNWSMGSKVTIDSSTLMNKGFEVIEAFWLFGLKVDQIEAVIHPQSLVHGLVEFIDSSMIAQISAHDMHLPIQYALTYPDRFSSQVKSIDFTKAMSFEFMPVDNQRFRCLDLAFSALKEGGSMACFMNGVNETLVKRFLNREIRWCDIAFFLEELMNSHQVVHNMDLESILAIDKQAKQIAESVQPGLLI
ncbi:MAG: 1-deoxy-D-xylulose-5-phosphate reductoisomerase [Rhabdochlamydiaceae bacterium]|nr:1-deoxy-D-xylulose-5-phosphate reductoisomerase [Candidatus Amphrikana amoebophyrae]